MEVGTPEWEAYALEELGHTVDVLSARGAEVMLLTSPCFKPRDLGLDAAAYVRLDPQRVDDLNDLYWEFARQHADQIVIADLNRLVCPEGEYTDVTIDGVHLREDGVHFTPEGADLVARWLAPEIIAAVPEGRRPTSGVGASGGASGQRGVLGVLARSGVNPSSGPEQNLLHLGCSVRCEVRVLGRPRLAGRPRLGSIVCAVHHADGPLRVRASQTRMGF